MTRTTAGEGLRRLHDMTWEEVAGLSSWVAILPVGAVEAHGPHLPLGTDCLIAGAMAEAAAARLTEGGATAVLLPTLAYTAAPFAAGFAGTLSAPADAARETVESIADAAADAGAGVLAIANAHLDPRHVACLRQAAASVRAAGRLQVAFPDVTRRALAARLTDEFRSGACHAGRYEGSIVMAVRPDLVREAIARELEPNPASLVGAIEDGRTSFEAAGGPRAYFGWPAEATAEEGTRTIEILGDILAEAVQEALHGKAGGGEPPP